MRITITPPPGTQYAGTLEWVLDEEGDGDWWKVSDLCADVAKAVGAGDLVAEVDGKRLDPSHIAVEVLSEGVQVTFVGA